MNFIKALLSEKLKEANPMLDIFGSDCKILHIQCEDLTNYLKVHWELVGKHANECEIVERLEKLYNDNPDELEEFLSVWTGLWLEKWKERVKLLIGVENSNRWKKAKKILRKSESSWRKLSNRKEIQELLATTFIKNGEICGTTILSKNILKAEILGKKRNYSNDEEYTVNIINTALKKARGLARSRGPLIFVKIDKGYYQTEKVKR